MHSQSSSSDILRHAAQNVRIFRNAAGLSQQELADRAGVSRRMLVSLEAGDVNISLGKLDAIAIALGVSFTRIVSDQAPAPAEGELMWRGQSPSSQSRLVGTAPVRREAEFWLWSLDIGESYQGEPDPVGYQEAIVVFEGTLTLQIDGEDDRTALPGTFTLFDSSKPYRYSNTGDTLLRFVRTVLN